MTVHFLYNNGPKGWLGLGRLNLGDLLCSPSLYFNLESSRSTLIIGGGIQSHFVTGKKHPPAGYDRVCIWGGGLSSQPDFPLFEDIQDIHLWTIRDRTSVPHNRHWLPCVSCMHPMLDDPLVENVPGKSLLYINADPMIYSPKSLLESRRIAKDHGLHFCTNRAGMRTFFSEWHKCESIVTNSYHGAFWSLLAGKNVTLFGYNYKFDSLLQTLYLPRYMIPFDKRNRRSLLTATKAAIQARDSLTLNDPHNRLSSFRSLQTQFAEKLCFTGIIDSYSLRTPNEVFARSSENRGGTYRLILEYIGATERYVRRRFPRRS